MRTRERDLCSADDLEGLAKRALDSRVGRRDAPMAVSSNQLLERSRPAEAGASASGGDRWRDGGVRRLGARSAAVDRGRRSERGRGGPPRASPSDVASSRATKAAQPDAEERGGPRFRGAGPHPRGSA
ncbi:hypothetical protein KM043_000202 [Ampulex compressa]|nr:hypothetical protein KM043_000202 [Ampulex compressa]